MNSFGKKPSEQYPVAWNFKGLLPPGSSVAAAGASAINTADNTDQTSNLFLGEWAIVGGNPVFVPIVTVSGTQATVTVRGGTDGSTYKLTMTTTLSPAGTLTDEILMVVGA